MIKPIIDSPYLLKIKSTDYDANKGEDTYIDEIIDNLIDTANYHKDDCLGLAANQIGYLKRVFVMLKDRVFVPVINPKFTMKSSANIKTWESCLSRPGENPIMVKRSKKIQILHWNLLLESGQVINASGLGARVIQHEMDHFEGTLI